MTSKIPDAPYGGQADWGGIAPISPPKDLEKGASRIQSDSKQNLPIPKAVDKSSEQPSLKTRVSKAEKGRISESRVARASELFKMSKILTKMSEKTPLAPFNPGGGHANDVYITNFERIKNTDFEEIFKKTVPKKDIKPTRPTPKNPVKFRIKDPEVLDADSVKPVKHEKPVSKTAEAIKANINNLDVVFKPGMAAAVRANICFGLTQLFDQFENVIAATKKGEASIVSRKDHNVSREIVYNPESDSTYLINAKYMQHQVIVKVEEEDEEGIIGFVDGAEVDLTPVDGHPGFFIIQGLPQKLAKSLDKDYSEDEGAIEDASDSDDDAAHDIYVMHVSPSRIEQWAAPDTPWKLVTIQNETYLVPQKEIVEITDKIEAGNWIEDSSSHEFDAASSMEDSNAKEEIKGDSTESGEGSTTAQLGQSFDSIRSSDFEIRETVKEEGVEEERDSSEEAKAFVKIDGSNFGIIIEDNGFRLLPAGAKKQNIAFEDIAARYELIKVDERLVLVPKSACVRYNVDKDAEQLNCDGKHFDVDDQYDSTYLLSPSYEINVESDEKAFVRVDKESFLKDHLIYQKNHVNYVHRNNLDYTIQENDNGLEVIGKNISGMVQLKVDKIFQKPQGADKALNLLKASHERKEFFDRIDMTSFIQAFLAIILLRPQDGKVTDLGESNILFQALPNDEGKTDPLDPTCKLRPVIIDLDETMPAANDFTLDPDFVKYGEKTNIHAVRNGLMGFPQANSKLTEKEKKQAIRCMQSIVDKNKEVNEFLQGFLPPDVQKRIKEKMRIIKENKENNYSPGREINVPLEKLPAGFDEVHIKAYNAIVHKLKMFLKENKKEWSLSDLFFFVFPEYADQWKLLGTMDPVKKAMHIGAEDPHKVRK